MDPSAADGAPPESRAQMHDALDRLARDGLLQPDSLRRHREFGPVLRRARADLAARLRRGLADAELAFVSVLHLENLSPINRIYGPALADAIQELAAAVIDVVLLERDASAEFGPHAGAAHLILHRTPEAEAVRQTLERIQTAVAGAALPVAGGTIHPQAVAAGVDVRDQAPYSANEVLRLLDRVGHDAEHRRERVRLLGRGRELAQRRRELETQRSDVDLVTRALAEGRVDVHFQPVVDLRTNLLYDGEALARIRRNGDLVAASDFIDAVYDLGEIVNLDSQVFDRVGRVAGQLSQITGKLFVNVSPISLASPAFLRVMRRTIADLRGQGLKLVLVLELTEQALLEHVDIVREIHDEDGVSFAVDDFGSGYSSLKTVSELAVANVISHLKIDGSLTRQLPVSDQIYKVVLSIANMARSLGIKVVAEHVENEEILARLRTTGVELGQGFVFSPALPASELVGRYHGRRSEEEPAFTPSQLHVLEPYLGKAFGAFYDRLLADPHFATFFRSAEQARALVERQRETFVRSLHDRADELRDRYVELGRLHHDIAIPFASFMNGADILHEELLEVLANVTNDGALITNTVGFFGRLKNHMARGYLERMIDADERAVAALRDGLRGAAGDDEGLDEVVVGCFAAIARRLREPSGAAAGPPAFERCPLAARLGTGSAVARLSGADRDALDRLHRAMHAGAVNLDFFLRRGQDLAVLLLYRQIAEDFLLLCARLLASAGPPPPRRPQAPVPRPRG